MKILVSSILCFISIFIGFRLYSIYKKENNYILEWDRFNRYLMSEIEFNKNSIDVIILSYKSQLSKNFEALLSGFLSSINSDNYIDKIGEIVKKYTIIKSDNKRIIDYFSKIGNMDYISQLNYLKSYNNELDELKKTSSKNLKTKGELSLKLSLILGIAIMILFV